MNAKGCDANIPWCGQMQSSHGSVTYIAREGIDSIAISTKVLNVLICFSASASPSPASSSSMAFDKWKPFFLSRSADADWLIRFQHFARAEDRVSRQSMWAVLREQFIFIAIGHPSFVADVAHSISFDMFCASRINEIIEVASRETPSSSSSSSPPPPDHLHFIFGPKMKHFRRRRRGRQHDESHERMAKTEK